MQAYQIAKLVSYYYKLDCTNYCIYLRLLAERRFELMLSQIWPTQNFRRVARSDYSTSVQRLTV